MQPTLINLNFNVDYPVGAERPTVTAQDDHITAHQSYQHIIVNLDTFVKAVMEYPTEEESQTALENMSSGFSKWEDKGPGVYLATEVTVDKVPGYIYNGKKAHTKRFLITVQTNTCHVEVKTDLKYINHTSLNGVPLHEIKVSDHGIITDLNKAVEAGHLESVKWIIHNNTEKVLNINTPYTDLNKECWRELFINDRQISHTHQVMKSLLSCLDEDLLKTNVLERHHMEIEFLLSKTTCTKRHAELLVPYLHRKLTAVYYEYYSLSEDVIDVLFQHEKIGDMGLSGLVYLHKKGRLPLDAKITGRLEDLESVNHWVTLKEAGYNVSDVVSNSTIGVFIYRKDYLSMKKLIENGINLVELYDGDDENMKKMLKKGDFTYVLTGDPKDLM